MRHAFTIMELMVSSVLIVLITLFLYSAIGSMTLSNQTLAKHDGADQNRSRLFNLLYRDLLEAVSIEAMSTKDKHFNIVQLQTANSLHEIDMPYVTYFVHTNDNALIRLEAAQSIAIPVQYENRFGVHADLLSAKVDTFNIYKQQKKQANSEEINSTSDGNQTSDTSILVYVRENKSLMPLLIELSI